MIGSSTVAAHNFPSWVREIEVVPKAIALALRRCCDGLQLWFTITGNRREDKRLWLEAAR